MKGKLIKNYYGFEYFLKDENGETIVTSDSGKLSIKNCQEIERGYDLDELALRMKALGFDEPCFGFYYIKEINLFESCKINERRNSSYIKNYMSEEDCSAPTFSQCFRWFRKKYGLDSFVKAEWQQMVKIGYYFSADDYYSEQPSHLTYEESELACLNKLLEIVEQKQKV
jgi:hypothetical protein